MSDDISAEVVQPEGQGDAGTPDAPYAEYLNRIPEEVRGQVEPVFKDWDANVTRRFQEGADYRKTWEPYEQLGVNNLQPDEVSWLMQFRQALEHPQSIKEWYEQEYVPNNGLDLGQPDPQEQQIQQQDDLGFEDPYKAQFEQVTSQLERLSQWQQQQEQQSREAESLRYVEGQINELKQKVGDEFNETALEAFLSRYIEQDPQHAVQRGWDDFVALRNQIQKDIFEQKAKQPAPAEAGGAVAAAPEKINSLREAEKVALEQLRQNRAA